MIHAAAANDLLKGLRHRKLSEKREQPVSLLLKVRLPPLQPAQLPKCHQL